MGITLDWIITASKLQHYKRDVFNPSYQVLIHSVVWFHVQ